eukprot:SM002873S10418  [mRNA]  locus=s2873:1121:1640:+ [translate_table: standard]
MPREPAAIVRPQFPTPSIKPSLDPTPSIPGVAPMGPAELPGTSQPSRAPEIVPAPAETPAAFPSPSVPEVPLPSQQPMEVPTTPPPAEVPAIAPVPEITPPSAPPVEVPEFPRGPPIAPP